MAELVDPVVVRWGAEDPAAPFVVLLHGRGAHETDLAGLAPFLPDGPAYAAVRAPLPAEQGFTWFDSHGAGRPVAESLAATMASFRTWLDGQAAAGRPVVLVGFSAGAAFAAGLVLSEPGRFTAAALLCGSLPFDAGVPLTRGRLAGLPVFLVRGLHDTVIPAELQQRSWDYLVRDSGAPLWAEREQSGHELTPKIVSDLGGWISARLNFASEHPAPAVPVGRAARWSGLPGGSLSARRGEPPEVSVLTPHEQQTQTAPPELQEALFNSVMDLPGVLSQPSMISVPGARAFVLDPRDAAGPPEAFIIPEVGEVAHLHPSYDGSLHLALPVSLAADALAKGWGSAHPLGGLAVGLGMVMIFGPRDSDELGIVTGIVRTSYDCAVGQ